MIITTLKLQSSKSTQRFMCEKVCKTATCIMNTFKFVNMMSCRIQPFCAVPRSENQLFVRYFANNIKMQLLLQKLEIYQEIFMKFKVSILIWYIYFEMTFIICLLTFTVLSLTSELIDNHQNHHQIQVVPLIQKRSGGIMFCVLKYLEIRK